MQQYQQYSGSSPAGISSSSPVIDPATSPPPSLLHHSDSGPLGEREAAPHRGAAGCGVAAAVAASFEEAMDEVSALVDGDREALDNVMAACRMRR